MIEGFAKTGWRSSMAEQLICNQQVGGSTPFASSSFTAITILSGKHGVSKRDHFLSRQAIGKVRGQFRLPDLRSEQSIRIYPGAASVLVSNSLSKEKCHLNRIPNRWSGSPRNSPPDGSVAKTCTFGIVDDFHFKGC